MKYISIIAVVIVAFLGIVIFTSGGEVNNKDHAMSADLMKKFAYLSANGNSACSAEFKDSITALASGDKIIGSCCGAMSMHRYGEQVEGLKAYSNIPEIPPDPYDIDSDLADKLIGYYDIVLTPEEQVAYDYAMENSHEKGPCCCKCWRWYAYGGLGKHLIREYKFTGEQVTKVWDLSDGCGGEDHMHETG